MNLLELVQTLHREARLPGSPPSGLEGLSGRALDLLNWTIEAWNDVQREKEGRWKWMRKGFTLDTVADNGSYAYGACTDVATAAPIARFRAWHLDPEEPPLIYLVSEGKQSERELAIASWQGFRYTYVRGTHTAAPPGYLSVDVDNNLRLGPTPDGVYRITGDYWLSNQVLAKADDEPEMPADFHMLIPYRAITKYAYNTVSRDALARAQAEGTPLFDALVANQHFGLFAMKGWDTLA